MAWLRALTGGPGGAARGLVLAQVGRVTARGDGPRGSQQHQQQRQRRQHRTARTSLGSPETDPGREKATSGPRAHYFRRESYECRRRVCVFERRLARASAWRRVRVDAARRSSRTEASEKRFPGSCGRGGRRAPRKTRPIAARAGKIAAPPSEPPAPPPAAPTHAPRVRHDIPLAFRFPTPSLAVRRSTATSCYGLPSRILLKSYLVRFFNQFDFLTK